MGIRIRHIRVQLPMEMKFESEYIIYVVRITYYTDSSERVCNVLVVIVCVWASNGLEWQTATMGVLRIIIILITTIAMSMRGCVTRFSIYVSST